MVVRLDPKSNELLHIQDLFLESAALKTKMVEEGTLRVLPAMAEKIARSIAAGGKLMLCGNGGSAADAQHLAAELLVRLRPDCNREGIPAIALSMDSSTVSACANDFSFDALFERVVSAIGNEGDVLLGITTSGRSRNVNRALEVARRRGIATLGFLGGDGGESLDLVDLAFVVPSAVTGRIQEAHITAGHGLMELVEDRLLAAEHIQATTAAELA